MGQTDTKTVCLALLVCGLTILEVIVGFWTPVIVAPVVVLLFLLMSILCRPEKKLLPTIKPWVWDLVAILLIVGLGTWMLGPAAMGDRPLTGDHNAHYFRAWNFKNHLLHEGRIHGWTHQWLAGYPFSYHYPIGVELWVTLVYLLSGGLLTFSQAYGIAFWLGFVGLNLAVFFLARSIFGRNVAVLAAILFMTDGGFHPRGGWNTFINLGIVSCHFSMAFSFLALRKVQQMLNRESRRDIALLGLWIGLSVIFHPLQVINLALLIPLLILSNLTDPSPRRLPSILLDLFGAGVLGFMLSSFWLLSFIDAGDFALRIGRPWLSLQEMGEKIYSGTFHLGTWHFPAVLGLLGAGILILDRRPGMRFCGLAYFLLTLLGSREFTHGLIATLGGPTQFVEYERFHLLLKPYFFISAAYAAFVLFDVAQKKWLDCSRVGLSLWLSEKARPFWLRLWILLLALPVLSPFGATAISREVNKEVRDLTDTRVSYVSSRPFRQDLAQAVAWLNEKADLDTRFFRIAFRWPDDFTNHTVIDLSTELKRPFFKIGFTPALMFRFMPQSFDKETFRNLNIRYVVSDRRLPVKKPVLRLAAKFGRIHIYEHLRWSPELFAVTEGHAHVELEKFSSEEIILRVGPDAQGTLLLKMAYFPRWQATRDGESVPLIPRRFQVKKLQFPTVELKPGVYRFTFQRNPAEWLGYILSVIGFMVIGVLALSRQATQPG